MLKPHFVKKLVCLVPLLFSGTASASLFNYNFGTLVVTGGSINDSVGMTVDGITVGVEAYAVANDDAGIITGTTLLSSSSEADTGIYVSSSTSGNQGVVSSTNEGNNMDGGGNSTTPNDPNDPDEGLLFTFDQAVRLDLINFDSFTDDSTPDDFNLTVDGVTLLVDYNANSSSSPLVTNDLIQFDQYTFNTIVGTEFLFWADGNSDSFRIDRMEVTAVPVPAAVWLFGSGLLGLFGIARRKTRI